MRCRTPRPSGCSARRWRGRADRRAVRPLHQHLQVKGYIARGGQIVDATIVSAPKQRNSKDENETIKAGKTPEDWERNLPRTPRKTRTRAGPRSMARASMATRTTSASTSCTSSSASGLPPTPRRTTARSSTTFSIRATRLPGVGRQRLSLPRSKENSQPCGLKSRIHRRAERNRPLCRRKRPRTRCARRCAPASSTYSATRRTRWAADRADYRHRSREIQDRNDEPRLQHPPTCAARAGGGCARLSSCAWVKSVSRF